VAARPAIRKAIVDDNKVRPDYARIRVPVLAIYRTETLEQSLKDYPPTNEEQRAALNQAYAGKRAMLSKWQRDLRAGVPTARIVELPDASLYMFLSHQTDILREVRAFAAALRAFDVISIKPARAGDPRSMRMRVLPNGDLSADAACAPACELRVRRADEPLAASFRSSWLARDLRYRGEGTRQRRARRSSMPVVNRTALSDLFVVETEGWRPMCCVHSVSN
jgi:hypothetical protein